MVQVGTLYLKTINTQLSFSIQDKNTYYALQCSIMLQLQSANNDKNSGINYSYLSHVNTDATIIVETKISLIFR